MQKFTVGDKVVVLDNIPGEWFFKPGDTGVVEKFIAELPTLAYYVKFDTRTSLYGHNKGYVSEDQIAPAPAGAPAPSAAADLRLTPQAKTVLRYLKKRQSISPAEALIGLGISRLASCIHEIRRRAGYNVKMTIKRDEHGHKYARYSLAS